jgi:hypothetical protein
VEQLTGVHIDHFAEVNMDGFYELAKVSGGVEVCLNHPVYDAKSGADFRAGYQHLDAAQALAFVRQRDGLPNGDLDRTHRQQAFIDSVLHQLRTQGVLSDLSKVNALLSVAKRYVITDAGWNLLDFAQEEQSLTGGNLVFHTLPIKGYATIDNQDANVVDPASIKAIVHAAFYPPLGPARRHHRAEPGGTTAAPGAALAARVNVLNGGYTKGLARRVTAALRRVGYKVGKPGNTTYRASTAVLYGTGASAEASKIAAAFGVTAATSGSVTAGHVEVLLGASATVPSITSVGATPAPAPVIPTTGPQGGAISAQNGIPCVN